MGESGVGKSTWINGMLNYSTYDTLDSALADPPTKCFIPSKFTLVDKGTECTVYIGQPDSNENVQQGESGTQQPKSYSFLTDGTLIRLIDTPGMGDTRGMEKNKENVDMILRHLSQYNHLHGIAILLLPNNSKASVLFNFCLKELLRHLDRDARKNIMFVFTNARGTSYRPGNSYALLQKVFAENPEIGISLCHDNYYCMDNESVRFLAAFNCGVSFSEEDKSDYRQSWNKSVLETSRLVEHVRYLEPHKADATVTLNEVRRQISALTRPLAHITENINHNIQACKDQSKLISDREQRKKGLKDVLYVPYIDLKQVELSYPQTVCAASRCMEVRSRHGQNVNHYKTVCHDHCYVEGVPLSKFPEPRLQKCEAMNSSKKCTNCGCLWSCHMHINYMHESVETIVEDETIKQGIAAEEKEIQNAEGIKAVLSRRVIEYRNEEKKLLEASAEFGSFLKHNAILPYNDALKEYLELMIHEEKEKYRSTSVRNPNLDSLEQFLREYEEEVRILEAAMRNGTKKAKSAQEIKNLIGELFQLKHFGQKVREGLSANTIGQYVATVNRDVVHRIREKEHPGIWSRMTSKGSELVAAGTNFVKKGMGM